MRVVHRVQGSRHTPRAGRYLVRLGLCPKDRRTLLTLASSESGLNGSEPVDLAAFVSATLVNLQPEIDRLGLHIDQVTMPAHLEGDPLLVERLVANLLTNAVRHNVVDGRLDVVTEEKEGKAVISVTNTGPVIPPAGVDRLFQPFQRLDRRRAHYKDGQGLGLSIVRAIATAHHASIQADPLPEGGLSVRVSFPPTTNLERRPKGTSQDNGRGSSNDIVVQRPT